MLIAIVCCFLLVSVGVQSSGSSSTQTTPTPTKASSANQGGSATGRMSSITKTGDDKMLAIASENKSPIPDLSWLFPPPPTSPSASSLDHHHLPASTTFLSASPVGVSMHPQQQQQHIAIDSSSLNGVSKSVQSSDTLANELSKLDVMSSRNLGSFIDGDNMGGSDRYWKSAARRRSKQTKNQHDQSMVNMDRIVDAGGQTAADLESLLSGASNGIDLASLGEIDPDQEVVARRQGKALNKSRGKAMVDRRYDSSGGDNDNENEYPDQLSRASPAPRNRKRNQQRPVLSREEQEFFDHQQQLQEVFQQERAEMARQASGRRAAAGPVSQRREGVSRNMRNKQAKRRSGGSHEGHPRQQQQFRQNNAFAAANNKHYKGGRQQGDNQMARRQYDEDEYVEPNGANVYAGSESRGGRQPQMSVEELEERRRQQKEEDDFFRDNDVNKRSDEDAEYDDDRDEVDDDSSGAEGGRRPRESGQRMAAAKSRSRPVSSLYRSQTMTRQSNNNYQGSARSLARRPRNYPQGSDSNRNSNNNNDADNDDEEDVDATAIDLRRVNGYQQPEVNSQQQDQNYNNLNAASTELYNNNNNDDQQHRDAESGQVNNYQLVSEAQASNEPAAQQVDLQTAAGHHHKHSHGHYYQHVEVPKKKAWKFGFKRGNHKHEIERHEKGHKHKFHSSFKWHAKEKCKKKKKCKSVGKMTWHYEHAKKHHHG